jgi:ribosomal subunit interface protein
MEVRITARHVTVSAATRRRIEARLEKLTRYAPELSSAVVKLAGERHGARAEVLLRVRHKDRVAAGRAADPETALEGAVGRLEKQLQRMKDRGARSAARRRADGPLRRSATRLALGAAAGARLGVAAGAAPVEARRGEAAPVVRQRMPGGKPLSLEEAVEQLERQGGDFLVFVDSLSQRPCVLYRRGDGRLALVEARA